METIKTNAKCSCHKDKTALKVILTLTREELDRLLVERGTQPSGMWEVVVKEAKQNGN